MLLSTDWLCKCKDQQCWGIAWDIEKQLFQQVLAVREGQKQRLESELVRRDGEKRLLETELIAEKKKRTDVAPWLVKSMQGRNGYSFPRLGA